MNPFSLSLPTSTTSNANRDVINIQSITDEVSHQWKGELLHLYIHSLTSTVKSFNYGEKRHNSQQMKKSNLTHKRKYLKLAENTPTAESTQWRYRASKTFSK